jgi:hypothetical protein
VNHERWRRLEERYHTALARAESEHAAFLAEACADDETLKREVESLLNQPAYFGAPGEVVFAGEEKAASFIYRIKDDGSELQKMIPTPMLLPFGVSPDGQWVPTGEGPTPEKRNELMVYPAEGGSPILICRCYPSQGIDNGPTPSYSELDTGREIPLSEV